MIPENPLFAIADIEELLLNKTYEELDSEQKFKIDKTIGEEKYTELRELALMVKSQMQQDIAKTKPQPGLKQKLLFSVQNKIKPNCIVFPEIISTLFTKRIPAYYLIIVVLVFAGVLYFYTPKATISHTLAGKISPSLTETPGTPIVLRMVDKADARNTRGRKNAAVIRKTKTVTGIPLTSFNKQLLENTILYASKTSSKTVYDEMNLYTGLIMSH